MVSLAILLMFAGAPAPPPWTDEEVKKQLTALEDELCKANVGFDGPFFEKLTAREAIFTTPDGETMGREDVLKIFHEPGPRRFKLESCVNEDVAVRPLGTAAVVTGVVTVRGVGPSGKYVDRSRYTHTMAWREGRWQLVAAHGSKLPPPK